MIKHHVVKMARAAAKAACKSAGAEQRTQQREAAAAGQRLVASLAARSKLHATGQQAGKPSAQPRGASVVAAWRRVCTRLITTLPPVAPSPAAVGAAALGHRSPVALPPLAAMALAAPCASVGAAGVCSVAAGSRPRPTPTAAATQPSSPQPASDPLLRYAQLGDQTAAGLAAPTSRPPVIRQRSEAQEADAALAAMRALASIVPATAAPAPSGAVAALAGCVPTGSRSTGGARKGAAAAAAGIVDPDMAALAMYASLS